MNVDYKNTKVTIPLAVLISLAFVAGSFWLDNTYISKVTAEEVLDPIYLRQDTAAQLEKDRQIFELRREIRKLRGPSRRDSRPMFSWEMEEIDLLEIDIKNLGGTL